jgi:hypothetical protein
MIPGDERARALAQARRFDDARVRCFWDEERATGRAWGARDRERLAPAVARLLPEDSQEREALASWDPERQPQWDVAWFFGSEAEWPPGGLPEQAAWARQFEFQGGAPGTSGFFRGEGWQAEVAWSNWDEQFAAGMGTRRM